MQATAPRPQIDAAACWSNSSFGTVPHPPHCGQALVAHHVNSMAEGVLLESCSWAGAGGLLVAALPGMQLRGSCMKEDRVLLMCVQSLSAVACAGLASSTPSRWMAV